jgi:hypothetical protein
MEVVVNAWGVVLAAVAAMVIGSVWYARPVFGNAWIKLVKLDEKKMKAGAGKSMFGAAVMSLLTAYVLAHVTYLSQYFYGVSFQSAAISTAFWLWLGISFTMVVTHGLFEQRPGKLIALNAGSQLASLLAMGLVIGLVGV